MPTIWTEWALPDEFLPRVAGTAEVVTPEDAASDPYAHIEGAAAILAGGRAYDRTLIERVPDLLVIARYGIGCDAVDIAAATERGIAVCNTPDGPTISTAELTIALMMAVARNLKGIERLLREAAAQGDKPDFYNAYRAVELYGLRLGLVGLGRIGGHVATSARAMGMQVSAYDPYADPNLAAQLGVALVGELATLLAGADVVSLHLPLTTETHKLMNADRFAQMKPGAIFINAARGGHVDEAALIDALRSGHLFGAGLDVSDPEPPLHENPLLHMDNVVLTPHIASGTGAGKRRIIEMALSQVLQVLRGERPPHLVNPEVWERVAERAKNQAP